MQFILYELGPWERHERGKKLTREVLERISGFSRQSLWAKADIKNCYEAVKESLRKDISNRDSNQYHRILEQCIESFEK